MNPTNNEEEDPGLGSWNNSEPAKRPWFGPKRFGIGVPSDQLRDHAVREPADVPALPG
jgi:hypothetical protein